MEYVAGLEVGGREDVGDGGMVGREVRAEDREVVEGGGVDRREEDEEVGVDVAAGGEGCEGG